MTDPEGFLARWSRRKRDAKVEDREPSTPPATEGADTDVPTAGVDVDAVSAGGDAERPAAVPKTKPEGGFDLSQLPPIESITATTDIRPFLAPGVPAELRQAALRRAWVVDPSIRDFIGLSENAWDFTDPTGVPGFDLAAPGAEVRRAIAELLVGGHEPGREAAHSAPQHAAVSEEKSGTSSIRQSQAGGATKSQAPSSSARVAKEENHAADAQGAAADFASHHDDRDTAPKRERRSHGGALPE